MFINYSNHRSELWGEKQRKEASEWGEILDLPFLSVSPKWDTEEVERLAVKEAEHIISYKPDAVLCQGEFTLTFSIVKELKKRGVKVFAACSERNVVEDKQGDSSVKKEIIFRFVRFREFGNL